MVPSAYLEHQIPGRVRLRIPSRRGDGPFFEQARQNLLGAATVEAVNVNPATASLLVRHSGDVGSIRAEAARRGIFRLQNGKPAEVAARPVTRARAEAGTAPVGAAELGLSSLGLYQIARGNSLGSASEIFWNAYGAHRLLNNPGLALLLCGLGVWQTLRGDWLGPASALLFYAMVARKLREADVAETAAAQAVPGGRAGGPDRK